MLPTRICFSLSAQRKTSAYLYSTLYCHYLNLFSLLSWWILSEKKSNATTVEQFPIEWQVELALTNEIFSFLYTDYFMKQIWQQKKNRTRFSLNSLKWEQQQQLRLWWWCYRVMLMIATITIVLQESFSSINIRNHLHWVFYRSDAECFFNHSNPTIYILTLFQTHKCTQLGNPFVSLRIFWTRLILSFFYDSKVVTL